MISKRQKNRAVVRERILESARLVFAERGFDQATMADVARLAGVSRATVFNYFPAKFALVEAITEGVYAYYSGMLDAALADTRSSAPGLVRALFSHMGMGIESTQAFYRGFFREVMKIQVGLAEGGDAARTRAGSLERLERFMARGQERGQLRADVSPRDLAEAFDALANGTIVRWLYDDMSECLQERMQRTADIFLAPVADGIDASLREPIPELDIGAPEPTRTSHPPVRAV